MEDRRSKYKKKALDKQLSIDIKFDITELDLLCSYIISDNRLIRRGNIITLRNALNIINIDVYNNDQESLNRLEFIHKGIDARLNKNLSSGKLILRDILGGLGISTDIYLKELDNTEVSWVNNAIAEIVKELAKKPWTTRLQNLFRKSKVDNLEDLQFSLVGDRYIEAMQETYRQLISPYNCLVFGTQALNLLTGGGVFASRVYVILGLPGEGKSSTLLEMAIQIKKYNKNYQCKDPTKRPCVVLFVMENSIKETVQRLFNMTMGQDMTDFSEDEAIDEFQRKGLTLSDDDPIDLIIRFRPNLSEDTSYLYTIVDDLEDQGYEVICMLQDYLKRIRSVEGMFGGDLRLQLGSVVNEFKTFATLKNIPVITASQLNRVATNNIDTARAKNKADLVRMLGRSNVGESNLIIENADWIGLIAPEDEKSTGKKYLGMQVVKTRYYIPNGMHYAYIPYVDDSIKFVEDYGSPLPAHKLSLKSETESEISMGITPGLDGGITPIKTFTELNEGKLDNSMDNVFNNASIVAKGLDSNKKLLFRKINE